MSLNPSLGLCSINVVALPCETAGSSASPQLIQRLAPLLGQRPILQRVNARPYRCAGHLPHSLNGYGKDAALAATRPRSQQEMARSPGWDAACALAAL